MKRTKLKQRSPRDTLIAQLDALWFKILKQERDARCEISRREGQGLGTFHILPKGGHPRLRYSRQNCLLMMWLPFHHSYHHANPGDPIYDKVEEGIKRLRGENYRDDLLILEKSMEKHSMTYLQRLKIAFKQQLKKEK